jgi:hypothetical protein
MTEPAEQRRQQRERFNELLALARQRYLDAGGDPQGSSGTLHNNGYLTQEELQELFALGAKLSGFYVKNGYGHEQGRSWKLPEDSPLLNEQVEAES